jgi:hypothetical protein
MGAIKPPYEHAQASAAPAASSKSQGKKNSRVLPSCDVGGAKVLIAILYSILRACIGSTLAARRAGMKPARAAKTESTKTASISVTGS